MILNKTSSPSDTFEIIRGPSGTDPNVYKIATLLLLFVAVVTLLGIQLCSKTHVRIFKSWITCKENGGGQKATCKKNVRDSKASNSAQKRGKNLTPTSHTKTDLSSDDKTGPNRVENVYVKEIRSLLVTTVSENPNSRDETIQLERLSHYPKDALTRETEAKEDDFAKASYPENEVTGAVETQLQESHPIDQHNNFGLGRSQQSAEDGFRLNQLNRRRRRIGVCLSMASTDILSPSPKHVSTEENMETRNELPELQVNGVHCEIDKACSDANSQSKDDADIDATDEGQIQCAVRYNKERKTLTMHAVTVKTQMDPGIPGFLVEVGLLPRQLVSAKSRVYVTGKPEVDIELKEKFELSCLPSEIEDSTLLLSVKPMYSGLVLYAETNLKDLGLDSEKEVFLGGYLKSLSQI